MLAKVIKEMKYRSDKIKQQVLGQYRYVRPTPASPPHVNCSCRTSLLLVLVMMMMMLKFDTVDAIEVKTFFTFKNAFKFISTRFFDV